jgi:glycosyltransferase A (GT-A) superfamily protein (DUF2064 family)
MSGARGDLIVVLCKPPESPQSKTRLRRDIGDHLAEDVYRWCLTRTVRAAIESGATVRLAVQAGDPAQLAVSLRTTLPPGAALSAHAQVGPTFAARQAREIRTGLQQGFGTVTLCGSDLADVEAGQLVTVRDLASRSTIGILGAPDGGYAAISATEPVDWLEDVPMSLPDTCHRLVASAAQRGVDARRVPDALVGDIDTGEDYRRYLATREAGHGPALPVAEIRHVRR